MTSEEIRKHWEEDQARVKEATDIPDYSAFATLPQPACDVGRDQAGWGVSQAHWLSEIAFQLAIANEREALKEARKQNRHKGPIASTARRSSEKRLYWVEHWKTTVDTEMLPPDFKPKDGFKYLNELAVGEVTEGLLGTEPDAKITRRQ